jgi:hypothetical protein
MDLGFVKCKCYLACMHAGLGCGLIRKTLLLAGTECVEMVAVMAKYNPFGERAGMKKAAEQEPSREILRVSKVLEEVGFNVQLLGRGKLCSAETSGT